MADQIRMPSSGGGIIRYTEDYESKLEFSPVWVIVLIVVVILIELGLFLFGKSLIG